jgi:hypothetical protein
LKHKTRDAHLGLEAFFELHDEIQGVGLPSRLQHVFFTVFRHAVRDVLFDGAVEKLRFLCNEPHVPSKRRGIDVLEVHTV